MAVFVKHTGCDACGSSDARGWYSDGSSYCFSCGWTGKATIPTFKAEQSSKVVHLPTDLSTDFPPQVWEWVKPTGITYAELIQAGCRYSPSSGGLVRILSSVQSGIRTIPLPRLVGGDACFECRFYHSSQKGPKTKFYGDKESCIVYSGETRSKCLVIVEDTLSAIKVGRHVCAVPLFGSSVSKTKLVKMVRGFPEVLVWLDSDKFGKAQEIVSQLQSLGKRSQAIYTEQDPKYVSDGEIKALVSQV